MTGYRLINEHYEELQEILDCIKVGIYIADSKGNTLMLNRESEKTGGMTRDELIGKNMKDLIEIGYVSESAIIKVLASQREEQIIQELGEGGQMFITGVPLIRDGKVDLVVCTERDITETINLKELLKMSEEKVEKYGSELEYHRKMNLDIGGELIYSSFQMRTVVEKALRVARLDTTVLLTGESGTGKELVANLIYKNSERTGKPFIKINCAAIPENLLESEFFGYEKGSFSGANKDGKAGIFELVNGGTIFLDEIGDLPIMLQSKLLRVIQEKEIRRIGGNVNIPIDVRIITATNLDLAKAVEEGRFREDLFYRLNVVPIVIPPLRERKDDIEKLTIHFVEKFNKKFKMNKQISPEAISILQSYDWPGNVRELRNVLERIFVAYDGRMISKSQVENQLPIRKQDPENIKGKYTGTLDQIMDAYEKELLISLLNKHRPVDVANLLGVNKSTISRKIRKHNIRHSSIVAK